jgi:methyl-accepting chemotaxis protein
MIDGATGSVLLDSMYLQDASDEKTARPEDRVFTSQLADFKSGSGLFTLDGQRMAVASVLGEDQAAGAGWVVVASLPAPGAAGALGDFGWLVVLLVLLGVLLLGIALLLWIRTARERTAASARTAVERDELASRMDDLSGALERVAGGDLAVSLPVEAFGSGGLARMVGSFDETISRLRVLVAQAQTSGDQLSGSAAELLRLAAEQADMAGEQSAAVVETTVTIQQLAATATQIAESASGVSQAAGHMLALSEEGRVAVQDSLGAMDRIAGRVDSIAVSTGSLSDRVNEIGGILALLDDLSDQTNLLALNAAIEAARAGEHGRGFAVVAAEIRKLAERARESTGRIQGLVAEIQANMNATLTASEDGAREVRGGSQLAHGAVEVLQRIAERVEDAATSVKEISVATQQQRTASDQVVVAMTRLAAVSQQYAAGSRQAAVSAEQLTALAEDLQGSIDTFSVLDGSADASSGTATEGSAVLLLAEPEVLDEPESPLEELERLDEPEPEREARLEQPDEGPEATT